MKFTFDTEFHEHTTKFGHVVEPISLGMVSHDGRSLYMEFNDFDYEAAEQHPFLKAHVLPQLHLSDKKRISRAEGAEKIMAFIGGAKPEIWAYYADYDWVVFCCLFGGMTKLPPRWPMLCLDLKQELLRRGYRDEEIPKQERYEHHALADAHWNMQIIKWMEGRDALRQQQNQMGQG